MPPDSRAERPAESEVGTMSEMSMTSADVSASRPRRGVVTTPRKPTGRSKVTNGVTILHGLTDGRTHAARRYRDLVAMVCSDHGGADRMSEAQMQLARRFASLAVQLEAMDTRLANDEPVDDEAYARLTSTMVRVISRLGVSRVPPDVTPTLDDILAEDSHA
jgi:hypothetical protein